MRLYAAVAVLLLGTACQEPFSNEDILFLKAVPRNLEIDVPDEADRMGQALRPAQGMQSEFAQYYTDMVKTADDVNTGIFDILGILEAVTTMPTAVRDRDEDRRAWGPFQPDENERIEILLVVDRVFTSTTVQFTSKSEPLSVDTFFRYSVNARPIPAVETGTTADWVAIVVGSTILLEADEEEATGTLCINFDNMHMLDPGQPMDEQGVFCVGYDYRGEDERIDLAAIGDAKKGDLFADPDAAFTYLRREDNSGEFFFSIRGDVFEDGTPAVLNILTRWVPDLAGRADVEVCDELRRSFYAAECWNPNFIRTFLISDLPDFDGVIGSIENCPAPFRDDPIDAGPQCD